jgi:hypothetical protein
MNPLLLDLPEHLVTARLILRPPRAGDGPELNGAVRESRPELRRWMPWAKGPLSVDGGAGPWRNGSDLSWKESSTGTPGIRMAGCGTRASMRRYFKCWVGPPEGRCS